MTLSFAGILVVAEMDPASDPRIRDVVGDYPQIRIVNDYARLSEGRHKLQRPYRSSQRLGLCRSILPNLGAKNLFVWFLISS